MFSEKQLIHKGEEAKRESKYVDFKVEFDVTSNRDWCEIIKDIAAMANSGGGIIIFGVKDNGKKANGDLNAILNCDSADIVNKINKYTGSHFANFDILEIKRTGSVFVAMVIKATYPPLIFIKPGTYPVDASKQNTAFSQGTLYVRHGAKSEPAISEDLEIILEREISRRRSSWLGNIKQVIEAPADQKIRMLPYDARIIENGSAQSIQITDDENAPGMRIDDESLFKKIFKNDTEKVIDKCRKMFIDFKKNKFFYDILKKFKEDKTIYRIRYLDIQKQKGSVKGYYSNKVFKELEKYYEKKKNGS